MCPCAVRQQHPHLAQLQVRRSLGGESDPGKQNKHSHEYSIANSTYSNGMCYLGGGHMYSSNQSQRWTQEQCNFLCVHTIFGFGYSFPPSYVAFQKYSSQRLTTYEFDARPWYHSYMFRSNRLLNYHYFSTLRNSINITKLCTESVWSLLLFNSTTVYLQVNVTVIFIRSIGASKQRALGLPSKLVSSPLFGRSIAAGCCTRLSQ